MGKAFNGGPGRHGYNSNSNNRYHAYSDSESREHSRNNSRAGPDLYALLQPGGGGMGMQQHLQGDPSQPPGCSTDLERLLAQVTPSLQLDPLLDPATALQQLSLDDIWKFYLEPSVYGQEVATLSGQRGPSTAYFVPYLSAVQLYLPAADPLAPAQAKPSKSGSSSSSASCSDLPESSNGAQQQRQGDSSAAAAAGGDPASMATPADSQPASPPADDHSSSSSSSAFATAAPPPPIPPLSGPSSSPTVLASAAAPPPPIPPLSLPTPGTSAPTITAASPKAAAAPAAAAAVPPGRLYLCDVEGWPAHMQLAYEHFEKEMPWDRLPLHDMVDQLASRPCGAPVPSASGTAASSPSGSATGFCGGLLRSTRLADLHPSSWFAVAWYPVYRIPDAPLNTRFLTFHALSSLYYTRQALEALGAQRPAALTLDVVGLKWNNMKGERWLEPTRGGGGAGDDGAGTPTGSSGRNGRQATAAQASSIDIAFQGHICELQDTAERISRGIGLRKWHPNGPQDARISHPDFEFFHYRGG